MSIHMPNTTELQIKRANRGDVGTIHFLFQKNMRCLTDGLKLCFHLEI